MTLSTYLNNSQSNSILPKRRRIGKVVRTDKDKGIVHVTGHKIKLFGLLKVLPVHLAIEYISWNGRYVTFSAGPSEGMLEGLLARAKDRPSDAPANNFIICSVTPPEGISVREYVERLEIQDDRYCDCADYDYIPEFADGYNSNSYVHGLIKTTGGSVPVKLKSYVGGGKALPLPYFNPGKAPKKKSMLKKALSFVFSILGLGRTNACVYEYILFEKKEIRGIEIKSHGKSHLRLESHKDMPIRYELPRPGKGYVLFFKLNLEYHWPSIFVSATTMAGRQLVIKGVEVGHCGGFNFQQRYTIDGLEALQFSWKPALGCTAGDLQKHPDEQIISFQVKAGKRILGVEELPFKLVENGTYPYVDAL